MKASELVTEVQRILYKADYSGDADYASADILKFINRGRIVLAGGGERQHNNAKLPPLPDLLTSATVTATTTSNSVAMPATYQRGLQRVNITGGDKLKKYSNLQKMLDRYEFETGNPEAYCIKGKTLWYAPMPISSTSLTVYFHKYPTDLVIADAVVGPPAVAAKDDIPSELPEHLHFPLLVNYTLREIYKEVESGMDVNNPDTQKHDAWFQMAMTDLEIEIGPADGEAENVEDDYLTEDNIF